jgi:glycosyltransferase involved in cell wall biosynthesis
VASIDVVIPAYQYGHFLRECTTSALDQNVEGLRVLIIDNASTDNTLEIAQQLRADDDRVEIICHRRNLGPNTSYNEGVDWAKSDYFLLLDADDFLVDGALNRATSFMEKHPVVAFA